MLDGIQQLIYVGVRFSAYLISTNFPFYDVITFGHILIGSIVVGKVIQYLIAKMR